MDDYAKLLALSNTFQLVQQAAYSTRLVEQARGNNIEYNLIKKLETVARNFKNLKKTLPENSPPINAELHNTLMQIALNLTLSSSNSDTSDFIPDDALIGEVGNIENTFAMSEKFQAVLLYSDLLDVLQLCNIKIDSKLFHQLNEITEILGYRTKEMLALVNNENDQRQYDFLYKRIHSSYINLFKTIFYERFNAFQSSSSGGGPSLGLKVESPADLHEIEIEHESDHFSPDDFMEDDYDELVPEYEPEIEGEVLSDQSDTVHDNKPNIADIFYDSVNQSLNMLEETKQYVDMLNNTGGPNVQSSQI